MAYDDVRAQEVIKPCIAQVLPGLIGTVFPGITRTYSLPDVLCQAHGSASYRQHDGDNDREAYERLPPMARFWHCVCLVRCVCLAGVEWYCIHLLFCACGPCKYGGASATRLFRPDGLGGGVATALCAMLKSSASVWSNKEIKMKCAMPVPCTDASGPEVVLRLE